MSRRRLILGLLLAPALAACGRKGPLEPPPKDERERERKK